MEKNERIEFLKNNYTKYSKKELAKILNTTIPAITTQAYKLGINKKLWSSKEIDILEKLYPTKTNQQLSKILNRPSESIGMKARSLGLKKSLGLRYHDLDEYIIHLKELAKLLNRTPLYTETENKEWFLPTMTLSRYVGGYREACKLAGLPINMNIFGSKHPQYESKNGDLCWSKAEVIISNFFIDNNIVYTREVLYSKYMDDEESKTKNCDWVLNNKVFVEYFGMMDKEYYKIKASQKIDLCKRNGINLVALTEKDLTNLESIFNSCLTNKIRNE